MSARFVVYGVVTVVSSTSRFVPIGGAGQQMQCDRPEVLITPYGARLNGLTACLVSVLELSPSRLSEVSSLCAQSGYGAVV